MRLLRSLLLASIALGLIGVSAASAFAAEEDFLYDPGTVNVIEIQLAPEQIKELEDEPREYVENGEVVLKRSDGTPAGIGAPSPTFKGVEVKLKGQPEGSFEDLGGKAAFKLKFKKKELFFGVRKLTLNNMTQDPSMVSESLAYTALGAAGVPASRSGYAFVYLNGSNYGLHANVESLDTYSLPKIFGVPFDEEKQHLYEAAEYGADFYPGKESMFEVDEGKDKTAADIADLTNAIAAVEANGSTALTTNLASYFDFAELTRMWAVEKYIGHWDGYAGAGIPGEPGFNLYRPNNYYLYSDPQGKFSMLPWGTDQTWGGKPGSGKRVEFDEQDGRLFDFCLADKACAGMFSAAVANALDKVGGLDLDAQAAATAAMLEPWQALEQAPHDAAYSPIQIAAAVTRARDFIADRPAEARTWLEEHPPPFVPGDSGGVVPPLLPVASAIETPNPEIGPPALIPIGAEKGEAAIRLTLRVDRPGDLVLQGRSPLEGRRRGVCRDEARADRAGSVTLVCRLSSRALQRLGSHSLPVFLRAILTPDVGPAALYVRQLTLPRR
jgi:hypothetical protein